MSAKMKVNRIHGILLFMALLSASCLFQACGDPIPDEEQQKIMSGLGGGLGGLGLGF